MFGKCPCEHPDPGTVVGRSSDGRRTAVGRPSDGRRTGRPPSRFFPCGGLGAAAPRAPGGFGGAGTPPIGGVWGGEAPPGKNDWLRALKNKFFVECSPPLFTTPPWALAEPAPQHHPAATSEQLGHQGGPPRPSDAISIESKGISNRSNRTP